MAKAKEELAALVSGFTVLNEDMAYLYTVNLLQNLSIGVEEGTWSEEKFPEEFAEARRLLTQHKAFFVMIETFMDSVRSVRELYPRTHWWWWIEEL